MSREEIIRIFRSETIGATPSGMTAGELATNLADRKLFIGGSQGDNIAFMAISSITGTANEIDVMVSATGSVVIGLVGSAGSLVGLATTSLTGVASFDPRYFTVATTGHVGLLGAYQVTGQTVVSGGSSQLVTSSGNTVTIDNRVASLTVTGVASFDPRYFTVGTTGHVGLTATFFSAESEQNYPVGGFSASGLTGDRLLLATGPANNPFRSYIRYENQWFQTGVVGVASPGATGANGTQILLIDSFSTSIDDILMKANTPYSLSGETINVSYAGGVVPATGGIYLVNPSQGTGFPVGFPTSAMNTLTFSSQTLTAGVGETITLRLVVTGSSSGDAYDFSVGMGNTIRWGGSTHASLTGSQLGTALANELLVVNKSSGLPHSIDINIGYNQYIFYALPTRLGGVKQSINNAAYGGSYLQGDLDLPGDASVTHANTAGFSESFYVYRSKNPNLGLVEVRTVAST